MKKFYIKTYGCQMNEYDSGKIADLLLPMGYEQSDDYIGSNLVVLNTCHIREKAAEKVYSELGRINQEKDKLKRAGKRMFIAVAGCVAQAEGEEIIRRAPYVDMVVGPQSYQRLPQLLNNLEQADNKNEKLKLYNKTELNFEVDDKFDSLPEVSEKQGTSAFLTIQEGCDKFCSFCVVPYTRGAEFSRPVEALYREATALVEKGVQEITLLGQNVNAYHGKGPYGDVWGMGSLVRHLAKIKGLERIRYVTSHPRDVDEEQINAHRDVEKLMPYLHLPVQSGSNNVLKLMNRQHTRDDYLRKIDAFRKVQQDIAFSSDFIVGHPGETEQDFYDTMDLVKQVGYTQSFSFIYSQRPGTPASLKEDAVEMLEKKARLQELQDLLWKQMEDFNEDKIGLTMPVLFNRSGKNDGQISGYSPYLQPVFVDGGDNMSEIQGRILDVKITESVGRSLKGEIAPSLKKLFLDEHTTDNLAIVSAV